MKRLLIALSFLLIGTIAEATDRYASPTGSGSTCSIGSPCSLSTGIAATVAGDTLYLRAGTYDARFNVISGITIAGYPGELPLIKPSTGSGGMINFFSNSGFTLRNLEISGQGLTMSESCVGGSSPTNAVFEDLKIHDCVRGPGGGDATGVGLLLGGSGHIVRRLESYNNNNSDPSAAGDNGGYGIYMSGSNSTVEYNYFHDNGGAGAQIYPAGGNTIRYNRFFHNGYSARKSLAGLIIGGANNSVYSNISWANNYSGIDAISGCTGCTVYNNTIYSNGAATGAFGLQFISGSSMTQRNNIYQDNPGGNIVDWIGTLVSSNNLCFGSGGTTNCAISGQNPLFQSPSTSSTADFHLQNGSPAINAGVNLGSPYNTDFAGVARPTTGPWEIGAYEAGAVATCPTIPPALVAAYSFDNTNINTTGGLTAALGSGVTYTSSGKYGAGLLFNGTGGVTIADADALDFCNGFTLEAWVSVPSLTDSMFINKNPNSTYFLGQLTGLTPLGAVPAGGFGGSSSAIAFHGLQLTPSTLTHLAISYDATTVSLYKNGFNVASVASSAMIGSTTGSLQFCDSSFGELCPNGTILDEVRLYNYARNVGEINNDMNTPITPSQNIVLKLSSTLKMGPGINFKIGVQ